jgi:hypothetical protein
VTEDERIELGAFCGGLLSHPSFNVVCSEFEKTYCNDLLNTRPDQKSERESIYATYQGAKTFIGFMGSLYQHAKALGEANDPPADELAEDEPQDDDY